MATAQPGEGAVERVELLHRESGVLDELERRPGRQAPRQAAGSLRQIRRDPDPLARRPPRRCAATASATSASPTRCTVARYSADPLGEQGHDLVTLAFVLGAVVARHVAGAAAVRAPRGCGEGCRPGRRRRRRGRPGGAGRSATVCVLVRVIRGVKVGHRSAARALGRGVRRHHSRKVSRRRRGEVAGHRPAGRAGRAPAIDPSRRRVATGGRAPLAARGQLLCSLVTLGVTRRCGRGPSS